MKKVLFAIVFSGVLSVAAQAGAATLNYVESVDGELPKFATIPQGVLDIGVNTISGKVNSSLVSPALLSDWDVGQFSLAAGLVVTGISIVAQTTDPALRPLGFGGVRVLLGALAGPSVDVTQQNVSTNLFAAFLPQSGLFAISIFSDGGFAVPGELLPVGFRQDYTLSVTVAEAVVQSVPLPPAIISLGLGLLGLGLFRRLGQRRRQERKVSATL